MSSIHAIINPIAGGGYASEIYRSILEEFRDFDLSHELTSGPGDATELAAKAVDNGAEFIMCIGGDGTLNEIAQTLAHSEAILVPISAGTGSDFVKTLQFKDINTVKKAITDRSFINVDLGKLEFSGNSRYFLNILEVGFGASVMERVNSRKKVRGGASFTSSVLALIPSFRPYSVTVMVNDVAESLNLAEMVVANGRYFGGGMLAAPDAELDDGLLDVHIVSGVGRFQMMMKLRNLKNGSYVRDRTVKSFKTGSIDIMGSAPVELDGEVLGTLPAKVVVERGALRVLSPGLQK